ncbi:tight adherence pilus pseudopilin TadF [Marinomonas sp. TI.3.20]|uniref:tight adherence pilus pseudopilin TadF n=1 Tax=Marinomonas sp. TI.3.20 TaxID=3121296 RepID=UPI00311DFB1E
MNGQNKEQGNFTVEFAIIAVFFSIILVFCANTVNQLAIRGKLDRMSYSAVSIIKERTQLFTADSFSVPKAEFDKMNLIVENSLARTMSHFDINDFGSVLEVQTFDSSLKANILDIHKIGIACNIGSALNPDLSVVTSWGRKATLYRVTLCYKTTNLFGTGSSTINSSSISIGR